MVLCDFVFESPKGSRDLELVFFWKYLKAGDGDSFNNPMLSRFSHSIQSSFDTRRLAVQAVCKFGTDVWI